MFEEYLDQLENDLSKKKFKDVLAAFKRFKKKPEKGYIEYLQTHAQKEFMLVEQSEEYIDNLIKEYDTLEEENVYIVALNKQH